MQLATLQAVVASSILLLAPATDASGVHRHLHHNDHVRRHTHLHHQGRAIESPPSSVSSLVKRGGTCQFPTDDPNLVAITPDQQNAGWAMSPDQPCKPNSFCPIACKPGMVMNQWDKDSTYTYPASMNGGLYCDADGNIQKPFPGQPNCVPGTGSIQALNTCSGKISFCQTVLPGNEAMLIPTVVDTSAVLAVPALSYWQGTSAHYYINSPGVGSEGCIWGTDSHPVGNWAIYVAGANTDANGQTFVKLGVNPVWMSSNLAGTKPDFGVRIDCPGGGCNGLPCEYKPGGILNSNNGASGAGGASFCVVTVPKGQTANIVAYEGSGGHTPVANANAAQPSSSSASPSPSPPSSTTTTHSSTPSPSPTSTSTSTSTTSTSTSSSSSSSTVSSPSSTTTTATPTPTMKPGIFHENNNSTSTVASNSTTAHSSTSSSPSPTTKDKKNEGGRQQGNTAIAGLVVALVAAACFY